jgi:8-oxo-dGTP diphosphatase
MKHIFVAAGVLLDASNRILIAQRPKGADQELLWEFPGGKLEKGETPQQAIERELKEELGVSATASQVVFEETFRYPDKVVTLYFIRIDSFSPEPKALEHQEIRWVVPHEFSDFEFPLADHTFLQKFEQFVFGDFSKN